MRRRKLERRAQAVCKDLGVRWFREELDAFLDRLQHIAGDDLTAPDFRTIVRLYNRELIGRRRAKREQAEKATDAG